MKKLLLISYNFAPEPTGIGKYNGEMINWLVKQGYDCTVITSYPYYPYWKVQEPYYKKRFLYSTEKSTDAQSGGKLTIHRCPMYVPQNPTGLRRMMLEASFFIAALFRMLLMLPVVKFNFVLSVAPSFHIGLLGILYKKLRGARLLYHVQDMQIEAARDLKMVKSETLVNALFKLEKHIFSQSDVVSSISEEMVRKIENKAEKQTVLFPNWTDINSFFPISNRSSLKTEFGFIPSDKVILYAGAIGEKQGLESIIYAADTFKHYRNVKFVICGSGPYKEKLEELSSSLCLTNVYFFPLQPLDTFNRFLNMADVHLVIQKANASDLVMPSKLTSIFAVGGLALITANKGSGLHNLIKKYNIGYTVDAEDQQALNAGIERILSRDLGQVNRNARQYAEQHLAIDNVMNRYAKKINSLTHPISRPVESINSMSKISTLAS